jgi:hypothetical protein
VIPDPELEAAVERELARRAIPPYRPEWAWIVCGGCGRRLYDDDGKPLRSWRKWIGC